MKIRFLTLSILLILGIGFISYSITHALFSDTAQSTDNTFTAAEVFGTPTPTPTPTPIPTPGPGDVVINEINWVGSGLTGQPGQDDEWLELRNMTSSSIDISGWKITGAVSGVGDFNISSGTIPANGFFLISNFNETTSRINIAPDIISTTLQLDNANAQYILKDGSNNVIDTADDGSGAALAGANGPPKRSMERKDLPGDGTLGANWQDASTHTNMDGSGATDEFGTPKAANGL